MEYALRLVANNVVGPSPPSEPTKRFQTIQAPPSHAPYNVTVRAVSATQLRVRWTVCVLCRLDFNRFKRLFDSLCASYNSLCSKLNGTACLAVTTCRIVDQMQIHLSTPSALKTTMPTPLYLKIWRNSLFTKLSFRLTTMSALRNQVHRPPSAPEKLVNCL